MPSASRPFWPLYILWIGFCVILFILLRDAEDPSRRSGRILSQQAGRIALQSLRARDADRFRDYEVVHVAWGRDGEGGPERRWIVLADRAARTGLKQAFVVELAATDGRLLRIRRPVRP